MTPPPRYCIIAFLAKHPTTSLDDFRTYYETQHIPLILRTVRAAGAPLPLVYTRRYLNPKSPVVTASGEIVGFDCMTELQFASKEDFEENWVKPLMVGEGRAAVEVDEARFLDRGRTMAYQFEMANTEGDEGKVDDGFVDS